MHHMDCRPIFFSAQTAISKKQTSWAQEKMFRGGLKRIKVSLSQMLKGAVRSGGCLFCVCIYKKTTTQKTNLVFCAHPKQAGVDAGAQDTVPLQTRKIGSLAWTLIDIIL